VLTRFCVEIASEMSFLVVSDRFKNMWMICVIFVVFLHLSVGLLNFVIETQQQENIIHTTTTLSEARCCLAATSSGELVFFGGGLNSTGPSDRVDIYNVTSGSWTTATLSITRGELAATSSQNLVFFGGGRDGNFSNPIVYDRVDIYNTLNRSWSMQLSLNLVMLLQPLLLEILFSLEVVTIRQVLPMLLMCLMRQVTHGQLQL
jgi:hypothetical protein